MELRQLEYFVAVAEEANFTRAAARVHISQSGVSAQVRQLERELGQTLLDRTHRAVRLTDVGAALLPHARAALDAAANARLAVDQLAGLVEGRVAVGMVQGCALPALADLLAGFHRRFPGVTISLEEGTSDRLVERLLAGDLDLALIGTAGPPLAGVDGWVLVDDPLVAVGPEGGPDRGRTALTVPALRDRPLVCLPTGTGVRAALDAGCAAAGFDPRIVFEASALPMVVQLAARGLGVGIVPASAVPALPPATRAVPITRPSLRSRLELVWSTAEASNPAARVLIDHAREHRALAAARPEQDPAVGRAGTPR